ncbi:MAG: FAD/NAD(P)-binding protein, partial [Bacteroidota bacterium]
MTKEKEKHFAILGGGPSGLFMYKRFVEAGRSEFEITIFEKKEQLGSGMPYSTDGANIEHITNVSDNEIPEIVSPIEEWVNVAPPEILDRFDITPANFNEFKVLPRLFFGEYLSAQFELLHRNAKKVGIKTHIHVNTTVTDIIDHPNENKVVVITSDGTSKKFDGIFICTGHNWPTKDEGVIPGYFDSPYPPSKLVAKINYPVAIKGSSLTAIDAIRTLARNNGTFIKQDDGMLSFQLHGESQGFKLVMHSLGGLLPAIRFHLEDSHLSNEAELTTEELIEIKAANEGFVPLDLLFERNFKDAFRKEDPAFYEKIKDMNVEEFVATMMELRERLDAFQLFKAEYAEAAKSINRKQSVYWKEMLAVLSFAMNYPAKHLSAEDMMRLKKVLMPLISIVIAFVPQSSAKEMLALFDAGVLDLVSVDRESKVEPQKEGGVLYTYLNEENKQQSLYYKMFVNCIGQPHLSYKDFPFKRLLTDKTISPARIQFKNADEGERAMQEGNKDVEKDDNG